MSVAGKLVAAVAWTLPRPARQRYREEWHADLAGTRELELSQRSVVGGAVMATMTIDRTDPRVTGVTKAQLITNRIRWAAAFLASAAVLGAGLFLWGGYESLVFAPLAFGIHALAFLFATLGLFACWGALVVAFDADGRRTLLVLGIGVVVVTAIIAAMFVLPITGLFGFPMVLAIIIVALSGKRASASSRPLPTWRRVLLTLPFTVLTLVIVTAGVLHITVWNPLARVPGLSLDEIYQAMAASNETPVAGLIIGWASFWSTASLTLPILAGIPRLSSFFTTRRLIVTGLLVAGATASFHWVAGFNMGMSLADTFMTSGADAAMTGPVIAIVGQIVLVAALLVGLSPRPHLMEATEASPAVTPRPEEERYDLMARDSP